MPRRDGTEDGVPVPLTHAALYAATKAAAEQIVFEAGMNGVCLQSRRGEGSNEVGGEGEDEQDEDEGCRELR